jgi:NAD(P)-dependent dehydrogenase (short-subunit alcohol dehydrogenase family)
MGLAITKQLAGKAALLLVDVAEDRLAETKKKYEVLGCFIETMVCDISKKDQVQSLAEKAQTMGALGAIIHTAGLSPALAPADRIMSVNAIGTALILDAFYELAGPGSVAVVISSMSGHIAASTPEIDEILDSPLAEDFMEKMMAAVQGDAGMSYSLSKLACQRMVAKQADKWGRKGARIVSVSPGLIMTPMGKKEAENPQTDQMMRQMNPLGRYGEPEEIALPVEFLISPAASYINGTDLLIDGGISAVLKG